MSTDLSRLNRLIKRQDVFYHRCARQSGLTDTQFWVLYALCESQTALCQNSLCENWCYSKQTVNSAVAGLEKTGLIRLVYAKGSRKKKDLMLTPAGEQFCDDHIRLLMRAEDKALMQLTDQERESFFQTLEQLLSSLEQEL